MKVVTTGPCIGKIKLVKGARPVSTLRGVEALVLEINLVFEFYVEYMILF